MGSVISEVPRLNSLSLSSITCPLIDPRTTNMTRVGSIDSVRFSCCCGAGVVDLDVAAELVVVVVAAEEGAGDADTAAAAAKELLSVMLISWSLVSIFCSATSFFTSFSSLTVIAADPSAVTAAAEVAQRSLASILQTTVSA